MENSTTSENVTTCGIPHAEEAVSQPEEARDATYEFQITKVVEEIKKISKSKPTVCILFKALPQTQILEELEHQGYNVKFDAYFDSTKENKYNCKLRITNPKFSTSGSNFVDQLEDKLKGCAFTQSNFQVSEEAKNMFDSFLGSFNQL